MSQMLDKVKSKVDNTTKIEGDKPITMEELKEANKALLKNRSTGIDGLPAEFIKYSSMSLNGSSKYYKN